MRLRRTSPVVLALCAVVATSSGAAAQTGAVCGNGIVEANEQCDGTPCCTSTCVPAPNGTPCGKPAEACQLGGVCLDFTCFPGGSQPDGVACEDGDPCTVGDVCRAAQCIPGQQRCAVTPTPTAKALPAGAGAVIVTVDCSAAGGAGGTCSAAAFLPAPPAASLVTAPVAASTDDLSCDFTRQITRTASRPLDATGTAHLKLRLNKLARRLVRRLPTTADIALTVCTKIDLPNGDSITLVDVVTWPRG